MAARRKGPPWEPGSVDGVAHYLCTSQFPKAPGSDPSPALSDSLNLGGPLGRVLGLEGWLSPGGAGGASSLAFRSKLSVRD